MNLISTLNAPQTIGHYSQAIETNNTIYISGQLPINPESGEVVEDNMAIQTGQVIKNLLAILREKNLDAKNIVKTTIFTRDISQFPVINEVYGNFLGDHKPARSVVEVSGLPKNVLVEIEAIAIID